MGGEIGPGPTLRAVALGAIAGLDGVETTTEQQATVYARAGRPFARLTADALELRLESLVVHAALRTPDAAVSAEGPDWVRFAPQAVDRFAADRVVAWIDHAWRHADD